MGCAPSSSSEDAKFISLHGAKVVADDSQEAELANSSNHAEEDAPSARTILNDTYGRNRSEAPEVINEPGHWDIFISRTSSNERAELLAEKLYNSLREKKIAVWMNSKMDFTHEAATREGAENAKLFVTIVSDSGNPANPHNMAAYFKRESCLQELRWALAKGVRVQPIIDVQDKARIGEFLNSAPEDVRHLGNIDFLEMTRNPTYWDTCVEEVCEVLHTSPRDVQACRNQPGHWDVFLSHARGDRNAPVYALDLYSSFREKGKSAWLDVKMKKADEEAMREGVQKSSLFVAFVSDGAGDPNYAYFRRKWCCDEMRWAIKEGKKIVLALNINDGERKNELLDNAPEDLHNHVHECEMIEMYREKANLWDKCVDNFIVKLPASAEVLTKKKDSAQSRIVARANHAGVPRYFAHIMVQSSPVAVGSGYSRAQFRESLFKFRESLLGEQSKWKARTYSPIFLNDGDAKQLSTDIMAGLVHALVWCGTGFGLEQPSSRSEGRSLEELCELMCDATQPPVIVIVCLKYGAKRAARRLSRAGIQTVISIQADMFDVDGAEEIMQVIRPVMEVAHVCGCESEILRDLPNFSQERLTCQLALQEPVAWHPDGVNDNQDWLHFSREKHTPTDGIVHFDDMNTLRSWACDIDTASQIKRDLTHHVQTKRKRDIPLQIYISSPKSQSARGRAVALEVVTSFMSDGAFTQITRISREPEDGRGVPKSVLDRKSLLWLDLISLDQHDGDGLLTIRAANMLVKTCEGCVLITSDDSRAAEAQSLADDMDEMMEFDLSEEEHAKNITADELHKEFLVQIDGLNAEEFLLDDNFISCLNRALPQNRPVVSVYMGDTPGQYYVRLSLSDVGYLHTLRDSVLNGEFDKALTKELAHIRGGKDAKVETDASCFAEMFERAILELENLTPHQIERLTEIEKNWSDVKGWHLKAAAGAGKTFFALNLIQKRIITSGDSILFVASNTALALFVCAWLATRAKRRRGELLQRIRVMTAEELSPRSVRIRNGACDFKEEENCDEDRTYDFIILDEAHHACRNRGLYDSVMRHVNESTKLLLLSDVSQGDDEGTYPKGLVDVRLDEVVRSSKRIIAGANAFRLGSDETLTHCHQESEGPPLKGFVFEHDDPAKPFESYARQTFRGLAFLREKYKSLSLHNRVAILVPDEQFLNGLKHELEKLVLENDNHENLNIELISARQAAACVTLYDQHSMPGDTEWIVLDTISNFDGLERLIVICVGMDEPDVSAARVRSHIYRAVTRAHMQVIVINEYVRGGMFEFLASVSMRQERTFDHNKELVVAAQPAAAKFVENKRVITDIKNAEVIKKEQAQQELIDNTLDFEPVSETKLLSKIEQTVWDPSVSVSNYMSSLDFDPYAELRVRDGLFISHYQEGGGSVTARELKASLVVEQPWLEWPDVDDDGIWLEYDAKDFSENGIKEAIRTHRYFLLLLTKGYFTRWFCKLELRTAFDLGRELIVVHERLPERGGYTSFVGYIDELNEQMQEGGLYADFPEAKDWILGVDSIPLRHESELDVISLTRILARMGLAEPPSDAENQKLYQKQRKKQEGFWDPNNDDPKKPPVFMRRLSTHKFATPEQVLRWKEDHEKECVVCLERHRSHIIMPCGHKCVCEQCGEDLKKDANKCPICREPIQSIRRVYE